MGRRRGGKKLNARDYDVRDYDLDDYDLDYYDLVDEDDFSDGYTIFGLPRWKREPRMPKVNKLKDYIIIGERKAMERRNNNPSSPPPPWIELPRDVTANILQRLGPEEILVTAERVCSTWRSVCAEPSLWQVFDMKYSDIRNRTRYAGKVCRRAVDRSQGELVDIRMEVFCSSGLLHYISERCSSHLKKLSLVSCSVIRGLSGALKNLSGLQELHLFYTPIFINQDIETIGVSCPMLNSFTFNNAVSWNHEFGDGDADNRLALLIPKNMPNLRRLRLVGNGLNNEGLQAILDGCPNLELLDLLLCFGVDLECDDLGRRCSEKVKELRRPSDSNADCEWDAQVYDFRDYVFEEEDSNDGYSDDNSLGCYSCFEDDLFYNPYNDDSVTVGSVNELASEDLDENELILGCGAYEGERRGGSSSIICG